MTSSVGIPNVFLEFGGMQISQVLNTCHKLFTIDDVIENVEIWRKNHALGILEAIKHVFNDIDKYLDLSAVEDEGLDIDMDWEEHGQFAIYGVEPNRHFCRHYFSGKL